MRDKKSTATLFVTGTDTGVGKTLVAAALALHLTAKGMKVGVMKPIETGVVNTKELGQDASLLSWASGTKDADDLVSPYRFSKPLAPCQAATAEKAQIDSEQIFQAFRTMRQDKDIMIIEGAGGLMVPIRGGYIMADLAREMEAPLLVVTHPRLGTLNHTLLTTFAARAMGLALSGFIINQMPKNPEEAERGAPHLLSSLASADLLGVLPEVHGSEQEKIRRLAEEIDRMPAYQWLLNGLGLSSQAFR